MATPLDCLRSAAKQRQVATGRVQDQLERYRYVQGEDGEQIDLLAHFTRPQDGQSGDGGGTDVPPMDIARYGRLLQQEVEHRAFQDSERVRINAAMYDRFRANPDRTGRQIADSLTRFVWSGRIKGATDNLWSRERGIGSQARSMISRFIQSFETMAGQARGVAASGIMDGIWGRGNGVNGQLAAGLAEMFEFLRVRANLAGARVMKTSNYFPLLHDRMTVHEMGRNAWVDLVEPLIDPTPFGVSSRAALRERLGRVWDRISLDKVQERMVIDPGAAVPARRPLADNLGLDRELVWLSPQAQLTYMRAAGKHGDDLFRIVQDYIDHMARSISAMEVLGPDPQAGVAHLLNVMKAHDIARAEAAEARGASDKVVKQLAEAARRTGMSRTARDIIDLYVGGDRGPESARIANLGASVRLWKLVSTLGSMVAANVADTGSMYLAAKAAGIPSVRMLVKTFAGVLQGLPSTERRQRALEAAWVANVLGHSASLASRYHGAEAAGLDILERGMHWQVKLQGAKTWTEMLQTVYAEELAIKLSNLSEVEWGDLAARDNQVWRLLNRHGITKSDWELFRTTPKRLEMQGVKIIRPTDVAQRSELFDGRDVTTYDATIRQMRKVTNMIRAAAGGTVPGNEVDFEAVARALNKTGLALGPEIKHMLNSRALWLDHDHPVPVPTDIGRALVKIDPISPVEVAQIFHHLEVLEKRREDLHGINPDRTAQQRALLQAAQRFSDLALTESNRAVPHPDAMVRQLTTLGTRAGTISGEAVRSTWGFLKSFPLTLAVVQLGSLIHDDRLYGNVPHRIALASAFTLTSTVAAGIGMLMLDAASGVIPNSDMLDPENKSFWKFWANAFVRGGAGSSVADMGASLMQRGIGGLGEWTFGPIAADTAKAVVKAGQGKPLEAVGGAARDWIPFSKNITTRLLTERYLLDTITRLTADHPEDYYRRRRMTVRDRGAEYLWEPGELAP